MPWIILNTAIPLILLILSFPSIASRICLYLGLKSLCGLTVSGNKFLLPTYWPLNIMMLLAYSVCPKTMLAIWCLLGLGLLFRRNSLYFLISGLKSPHNTMTFWDCLKLDLIRVMSRPMSRWLVIIAVIVPCNVMGLIDNPADSSSACMSMSNQEWATAHQVETSPDDVHHAQTSASIFDSTEMSVIGTLHTHTTSSPGLSDSTLGTRGLNLSEIQRMRDPSLIFDPSEIEVIETIEMPLLSSIEGPGCSHWTHAPTDGPDYAHDFTEQPGCSHWVHDASAGISTNDPNYHDTKGSSYHDTKSPDIAETPHEQERTTPRVYDYLTPYQQSRMLKMPTLTEPGIILSNGCAYPWMNPALSHISPEEMVSKYGLITRNVGSDTFTRPLYQPKHFPDVKFYSRPLHPGYTPAIVINDWLHECQGQVRWPKEPWLWTIFKMNAFISGTICVTSTVVMIVDMILHSLSN